MAAPDPKLQFRVYKIPDGVSYRDGYLNRPAGAEYQRGGTLDYPSKQTATFTALAASRTGARDIYSYHPLRTVDYWIKRSETDETYDLLAENASVYTFSAELEINDVCTWAIEIDFPIGSPEAARFAEAADSAGAWSVWHITAQDDTPAGIGDFLEGDLFSGSVFQEGALFPTLANDDYPSFLNRGGGGPVMEVGVRTTERSERVSIKGTCWGKLLQQTVHRNEIFDSALPTAASTGVDGFRLLVSQILQANSEYDIQALTTDELAKLGSEDEDEDPASRQFKIDLSEAGLSTSDITRIHTPIAIHTIIAAVTGDSSEGLVKHLTDSYSEIPFVSPRGGFIAPGSHSVLRSYQRLAETTDSFFGTGLPVILWRISENTHDWDPSHYFDCDLKKFRPQATAWFSHHVDAGGPRDWIVYAPDLELVEDYGHIQAVNLSSAPRALGEEFELFTADDISDTDTRLGSPLPTGAALQTAKAVLAKNLTGQYILYAIKAQNRGLAFSEANRESADVDVKWSVGSRFGIDWGLGDRVNLTTPSGWSSSAAMQIRRVIISLGEDGRWSFKAGLGPRSTIKPGFRPEISVTPSRKPSRRPASSKGSVIGTAAHSAGQQPPRSMSNRMS